MEPNRISKFSFLVKQFINSSFNNFRKKVESLKFSFYNYLITYLLEAVMHHISANKEFDVIPEIRLLQEFRERGIELNSEDELLESELENEFDEDFTKNFLDFKPFSIESRENDDGLKNFINALQASK